MTDGTHSGLGLHDSRILILGDRPREVRRLQELLRDWGFGRVDGLGEGTELPATLIDPAPDLLVVALKTPGLDLTRLREPVADELVPVPILVVISSGGVKARQKALDAGACDVLIKPFDPAELNLRVSNLLQMRLLQLQLRRHRAHFEERVRERTRALEQAQLEIAERLAMAAEYRDDDTHLHADRIGHTTALLAARLGLSTSTVADLRHAAPLHDIGKIAISDAILLKPGQLTPEEFETMKSHTVIGARLLSGSRSRMLQIAAEIALSHHERWDGTGYPQGLRGEEIPLTGRIVAVADVFDSLAHRRPYKDAWTIENAAEGIVAAAGTHFDPTVVSAFASLNHRRLVSPDHIDLDPSDLISDLVASASS